MRAIQTRIAAYGSNCSARSTIVLTIDGKQLMLEDKGYRGTGIQFMKHGPFFKYRKPIDLVYMICTSGSIGSLIKKVMNR